MSSASARYEPVDIAAEWADLLASALASMTMAEVPPVAAPSGQLKLPESVALDWFATAFTVAPGFAVYAGAETENWNRLGRLALEAAGLADASDADARSTCIEMLAQASSGLAQSMTRRLGRDITAQPVHPVGADESPIGDGWQFQLEGVPFVVSIAGEFPGLEPEGPVQLAVSSLAVQDSRTIDLLLEVEMPVSVSFGRAQLPLRDVLKLNSGSIVELNRTISEPVDVIVNNCVIARGEVVVVDGNYGVRIQQVVSKEERLRTLS